MALAYGSSFELSPGVRKIFFGHSGALSHWKERWVRLCLQMSFYDCVSLFCYQRFSPSKKTQPHLCFPQQKNRKHARLICNTRRPEKRFGNKNYLHSFRLLHLFHKTNRARSLPPGPRTPSPPSRPPSFLPSLPPSLPPHGKNKRENSTRRRQSESTSERRTASPIRMQRSPPSRPSKFRKEKPLARRKGTAGRESGLSQPGFCAALRVFSGGSDWREERIGCGIFLELWRIGLVRKGVFAFFIHSLSLSVLSNHVRIL